MAPRKLRLVADLIRMLDPEEAVEILTHVEKRAAADLRKAIVTAVANAKDQGVTDKLEFKELSIGEGPRLKRGRAVSRGRWHPYQRKMSHVRIVLQTIKSLQSQKTQKRSQKTQKKGGE